MQIFAKSNHPKPFRVVHDRTKISIAKSFVDGCNMAEEHRARGLRDVLARYSIVLKTEHIEFEP